MYEPGAGPERKLLSAAKEYARGLGPLVRPEREDLSEGLDLYQGSDSMGPSIVSWLPQPSGGLGGWRRLTVRSGR